MDFVAAYHLIGIGIHARLAVPIFSLGPVMSHIRIAKITDSCECDDCGFSYADGARIYIDDELCAELIPAAACFDGVDFDDDEVYREVLKALDLNVVYSSEAGYFRRLVLSLGHGIEVIEASQ